MQTELEAPSIPIGTTVTWDWYGGGLKGIHTGNVVYSIPHGTPIIGIILKEQLRAKYDCSALRDAIHSRTCRTGESYLIEVTVPGKQSRLYWPFAHKLKYKL